MTEIKKTELVQLRVERTFLDKLNRLADKKNLPMSAMVRVWLSERLNEELKMVTTERKQWQEERIQQLRLDLNSNFASGPALAVHAIPLTPGTSIDLANIEKNAFSLIPWGMTGFNGRMKQHGYELFRSRNNVTNAKAQIFKGGQIEGVFAIGAEENQILGKALDDGIIQITSSYSHLLKLQQTPLPYQFNFVIMNAKGYSIVEYASRGYQEPVTFESDRIDLTSVNIDDWSEVETELSTGNHCRDMIDELWRAGGQPCSKSYDTNNQWLVRRLR